MKERPILFSGPMVRAILGNRKTQTRRVVKFPIKDRNGSGCEIAGNELNSMLRQELEIGAGSYLCPYGQRGDRLWVRETFCCKMDSGEFVYRPDGHHECYYAATETEHIIKDDGNGGTEYRQDGCESSPWKPSIHMPRWASRITLEIVSVRVERLQIITEDDAMAEGIDTSVTNPSPTGMGKFRAKNYVYASECFADLWRLINGPYSWDLNPWVWVIGFKRI